MILSDSDIRRHLNRGDLSIDPIVDLDLQLQPASFDAHLSSEFKKITGDNELDIDEGIPENRIEDISVDNKYVLEPGEFILGSTIEEVRVPNGLICRVEGRSSIGRLAVDIHATAGYVDPGFEGTITLEISNKNEDIPIVLRPNRRFIQLVFETTRTQSTEGYGEKGGKYQHQTSPVESRIEEDIENEN